MTIGKQTLQKRIEDFRATWPSANESDFTAEMFAKIMGVPRGTASATLSQALREGIISYKNTRPRKYKLFAPLASASNIDELLSIVVEIDAKGVKHSTIAPLLSWAANALLSA